MDQSTQLKTSSSQINEAFQLLQNGRRIAFIQAAWHSAIVDQSRISFVSECENLGIEPSKIDFFVVPGSLEIPLQAKMLANTGQYAIVIAAGLIVDGGIYRHDFVASTVLDALMNIQLGLEIPILSMVLTPHQFQETEAHENFFFEHFKLKGRETAQACAMTLTNLKFTVNTDQAV
ncbi:MAG: 6,7-dimethyl-8-ribityllumazine synthase [Gammaproteobacteria bacterium]|jgi:6,7-dimethyl-8-ribityllumazine synthase